MNDRNGHSTKYRLNSLGRLFEQNDSASPVFTVGLAYMLVAVLFFSVMSVLAKLVSPSIPTGQIVFMRACVGSVLAYWGVRFAGVHLWGVNKKLLLFRGIAGFGSLMCFFWTLIALPLAEATILFYTSPCLAAIIATITLRERLTVWIVVGFMLCIAGVFFVIQPEFIFNVEQLDLLSVLVGLTGALMAGLAFVSVRKLRQTDHEMVIIFYFSFISIFASIPFVAFDYVFPSLLEWSFLIGIGVFTHAAQVFLTKSLHREETSRAMGVSYIQILFASGWGILIFGEYPNFLSIIGMIMITAGSLTAAHPKPTTHPDHLHSVHSP